MAKKRRAAIDYADKEFSLYIKTRDGNRCIICAKVGAVDCAHYVSREKLGTRWHEQNGNALCRGCHSDEHQYGDDAYTEAIRRRHGKDAPECLTLAGNSVVKLCVAEIKEIGDAYKQKRLLIEKENGLWEK
ncbi:MAG: recombination protein NinG [Spirochaetales bacterium]|nr:recombination protein NinG [Spirochaetales bacterium]